MRLIKFFIIFLILLVISCFASWFYIADKFTSEINKNYAGKKSLVTSIRNNEYYVTFDKAVPTGFPFMMAMEIHGWKEEGREANFTYLKPIIAGYNFLTQKFFVEYNGEMKAIYNPVQNGFGANLKLHNYQISFDFPISKKLIRTISEYEDAFEFLNYIKNITVSTRKVEIYDLVDEKKFYDKEYEKLHLSFIPLKHYKSLEDFLQNIPQEYNLLYQVKTNVVDEEARRVPLSLFYAFFSYPSGFKANGNAVLKTKSNNFQNIDKNFDLSADFSVTSPLLDMPSYTLSCIGQTTKDVINLKLSSHTKVKVKEGFFDELFRHFGVIQPHLAKIPGGNIIFRELSYIVTNKDDFKFKELENSDYEMNISLTGAENKSAKYLNIQDFSMFSKDSGFKMRHESEIKIPESINDKINWIAKGALIINNYSSVVEFTSGYIYRFGKFKILSDEARKLYVDVNKAFLKSISDYPQSTSNDLSFEYDINSTNLKDVNIGSVKFANIHDLYEAFLYHKLLEKVGIDGDVIKKMKKIIPYLDEDSKFLKEILPKITTKNVLDTLVPQKVKDIIPEEIKDIKNKKGAKFLKDLIKNKN
jgi:hypothetical protein